VIRLFGGENREKDWTGMVHLPRGDVREVRIRAKFPRWGNWACFRNHIIWSHEMPSIMVLEMLMVRLNFLPFMT